MEDDPVMESPVPVGESAIMQFATSLDACATASTRIVGAVDMKKLENGSLVEVDRTTRTMLASPANSPAVGGVSTASIV